MYILEESNQSLLILNVDYLHYQNHIHNL